MAVWADWNAALMQAQLGVSPSELHGSVTGYLCAGWGGQAPELLAALVLESGDASTHAAVHGLLDAAAADIHARLGKGAAVEPLLPDGGLAGRADGMVDWCRGFLGGLGLTGVLENLPRESEAGATIADFGRIAAAHLECDADDTPALDEVLDFIRNGVVRLHAAFVAART